MRNGSYVVASTSIVYNLDNLKISIGCSKIHRGGILLD